MMELTDASVLTDHCIHDAPAPCGRACPFGLDVRSFMKKMGRGRFAAAYKELRTATVFPVLAAALCPQPCKEHCQRLLLEDEPLDLQLLEEAAIRLSGTQPPTVFPIPPKEEKIAVIGAGPAGLSLALNMAQKKYPVTVFEQNEGWGGALRDDPRFALFDEDFRLQFSAENVEFRFGTAITELSEVDGYAAVYIATGKGGNDFGLLASRDPKTMCSDRACTFLGGALCGMPLMESVACGTKLSRIMEAAVQTGKAMIMSEEAPCPSCRLLPPDAEPAAAIHPADPGTGYSKDEARAEAARCFQCNCSACLDRCELLHKYKKPPKQCAMEVYGDAGAHFLAGRTMTREAYSCNQCGWCESICPTGVNMGDLFRLSREDRVQQDIQPKALHQFWLEELDFYGNDGFFATSAPCDRVFFPGCQLEALLPEHVRKAYAFLAQLGPTGLIMGCCGAPAIWAGDRERQAQNFAGFKDAWERMGRPVIVTACASCTRYLKEQSGELEVRSIYEFLAEQDLPSLALPFESASVFDPCAAREDPYVKESVRTLAARSSCRLEELPSSGKCCGYGGHIRLADPALYKEITDRRAAETGRPYLVYCANCLEVFQARGKECAHILETVFGPRREQLPTLSGKRRNVLMLKEQCMKELEQKDFTPPHFPWEDLPVEIPADVLSSMEEKLIREADVAELIYKAELGQDYFEDADGVRSASLIRPVIVYWADYRREPDGKFVILKAYCHRMHFGGDADHE